MQDAYNGEVLDLVNDDDQVIGTATRTDICEKKLNNYRVVNAFLLNSRGEIWVPRRSKSCVHFPDAYDFSTGGHVKAGESYEEALRRELWEECRIDLDETECSCVGKFSPKVGVSSFMKVYRLVSSQEPVFSSEEFSSASYLPLSAFRELLSSDEPRNGDLAKVASLVFG